MMNSYTAAYYGVPVTFLAGDEELCEFAKKLVPGITTVAVKKGIGGAACSIHPAVAVREIEEKSFDSLANRDKCLIQLPDKFDMTINFREHQRAYSRSFYPGAVLTNSTSVSFSSNDWYEMLRFCKFVLSN
jgi:D-amino peptidase